MTFRTGCEDEGDPTACYSLGEWYAVMTGDYQKASELYRTSCDGGHANACFSLGLLYLKGLGGLERSREKALALWDKACGFRHDRACHMASEMLHYGLGVEKNEDRAREMRRKACDRNHAPSCHALGVYYLTSDSEENSKAVEPLERACQMGHGPSCHNLAVLYRRGDGVRQSDELFEKFARLAMRFGDSDTGAV